MLDYSVDLSVYFQINQTISISILEFFELTQMKIGRMQKKKQLDFISVTDANIDKRGDWVFVN